MPDAVDGTDGSAVAAVTPPRRATGAGYASPARLVGTTARMPASHRFRLAILAPLAAAVIALGCVSAPRAPSDEPQPTRATSTGTAGSDGRNQPEGTDTPQEFAQDIDGARQVADAYWAKQFDAAGLNFRPIKRVIPYERDGEVDCGGQPLGARWAARAAGR